jgi:hypothetical protein
LKVRFSKPDAGSMRAAQPSKMMMVRFMAGRNRTLGIL